jgi:hypothetical protein
MKTRGLRSTIGAAGVDCGCRLLAAWHAGERAHIARADREPWCMLLAVSAGARGTRPGGWEAGGCRLLAVRGS